MLGKEEKSLVERIATSEEVEVIARTLCKDGKILTPNEVRKHLVEIYTKVRDQLKAKGHDVPDDPAVLRKWLRSVKRNDK